jgi:hypothetical protein
MARKSQKQTQNKPEPDKEVFVCVFFCAIRAVCVRRWALSGRRSLVLDMSASQGTI